VQSASADDWYDQSALLWSYSTVTIHTRPMSGAERASFCPGSTADD